MLNLLNLLKPSHVAFPAVEFRTKERADQLTGHVFPDYARADAEHVHVVVLDSLVRRVRVVAGRRSYPRELGRRNGSADSRAADEDPAIGPPFWIASPSSRALSG